MSGKTRKVHKKEISKMLMIIEEFRKRNRLSLSKKKQKL